MPEFESPTVKDNKLEVILNIKSVDEVEYDKRKIFIACSHFYKRLQKACKYLTNQELVYLEHYLNGYSEETICEILNYSSRSSLKRIKESAIIKIAFYFNLHIFKY